MIFLYVNGKMRLGAVVGERMHCSAPSTPQSSLAVLWWQTKQGVKARGKSC